MFRKIIPVIFLFILLSGISESKAQSTNPTQKAGPKIVNIVNFIRECEPRDAAITHEVLYETVVEQIKIMKEYNLPGTFLLQYDALIDPKYQALLKALPAGQFEIGAWWEIPQQLVEKSGYTWRGRYSWDWHANVGFATGYTPEEREKLVDTYMKDFKAIFGYYPKSAGSWFIDAHTLNYMYEKYGLVASCNCKDQMGTDGYTLWGGYWNQAYYPSKKNAYMPAQNPENQIPVPIFRMLGSDPIHQYDAGLGGKVQHVVSLEPVYKGGGGNPDWCKWFFGELVNNPAMAFGYTQAGQENSFTWKEMEKGFRIQMPMIDRLRKEGKVEVQTLLQSGEWFRKNFKVTPATSFCALTDYAASNLKTVWFNSRFYRANLLWENGTLRFRDIHHFDENVESDYLKNKGTSTSCNYYTLPMVDGFQWSSANVIAGLRFKVMIDNKLTEITGGDPIVENPTEGTLKVTWPVTHPSGKITITFTENTIAISGEGKGLENWLMELTCQPGAELPITQINPKSIDYNYLNHKYFMKAASGLFSQGTGAGSAFVVKSEKGKVKLEMKNQ